ncbi:hypothetical protein STRATTON_122 [Erwinia phage vB_EamM_Stratton]|uniref:Uncharacterized protein n=2 Tax=Erskinevirus EaH2 TaxID=2169883 RepID=A0A1B2IH00_9CAUD|nr:hypothetical protein G173_gp027 [Erwinia phage phiEaH2]AFQ96572.1 hypothetical protein [Erwinia phage phiEaH2]ANZ50547.1 hypothetical protein STRATTON_122 [Erwinia phage vB_EamM_Stratton]
MNWHVHGITAKVMKEDHDRCKHLKVGQMATRYTAECDLFGRETYYVCEPCYVKLQEELKQEEVTCSDCGGNFPRKQTTMWKWYDFDHLQGDEALCICDNCSSLPRHQNRVEQDKRNYEEEFPEVAE